MTTVNKYSCILSTTERDSLKRHLIVNLLNDRVDVEFIQKWTGATENQETSP